MVRRRASPTNPVTIPTFSLYGDARAAARDMLHVEPIQSRSSLYHWEIDAHTHHGLQQILWVEQGPAEIALDAHRESAHGPMAITIPAGVVHAFRFAEQTQGQVLTFSPHAVLEGDVPATGDALQQLFARPRVLSLHTAPMMQRRLTTLFADLAEEMATPDATHSPVALWLARAIVWRLAQHVVQDHQIGQAAATGLYTRFLLLVENHHRQHWPVSRYADELGITVDRLNRLTQQQSQRAALEVIHERLTREATRRLTYVAASINQLAHELGFDDPAYFCRFFKRRTGISPSQFRRRRNQN